MNREERIIGLYLRLVSGCDTALCGHKLRKRGSRPCLTDAEQLTIEIFGEMQGHPNDAAIWRYAKAHWQAWFPGLGSYSVFAKQSANLSWLKQRVLAIMFPPQGEDFHIADGVPMPVCHLVRAKRDRCFKGEAAYGFCAAKNEHYYGFKGHIIVNLRQHVTAFTLAAANIDERKALDNLPHCLRGMLIGDKGLLSKTKQEELAAYGIDLQTPLRDNMHDKRPGHVIKTLLKTRRIVETVIGQLTEFLAFNTCKARDIWHLNAKLARKLLAYNLNRCKT